MSRRRPVNNLIGRSLLPHTYKGARLYYRCREGLLMSTILAEQDDKNLPLAHSKLAWGLPL